MRRVAALLGAGVLVALPGVLAPLGGSAAAATAHSVGISSYAFHPAVLTVSVGDTVTWTNSDQAPHDVTTTSAPVAIHGSRMEKGQSWSYTFTTAGTYAYICSIHPDMKATVIVQPAPAPKTTAAPKTSSAAPRVRYTTVAAAGGGMAMPATHRAKRHTAAPAHSSTSAAPTTPAGTPVAVAAAAPAASDTTPERPLRPLLIVAGGVAALATLCLLLLAARPEGAEPPPR